MKPGKAPGIDRSPSEAVKIAAQCCTDWVLAVMNNILNKQEFSDH